MKKRGDAALQQTRRLGAEATQRAAEAHTGERVRLCVRECGWGEECGSGAGARRLVSLIQRPENEPGAGLGTGGRPLIDEVA